VSVAHFFLTCFDWILPFINFLRRLGNLVAGSRALFSLQAPRYFLFFFGGTVESVVASLS
jgi:hypothetical protein